MPEERNVENCNCNEKSAIVARLKRIEGQVRGLIRMVEEDKPCEDIIIQIGSAKAALQKTGQTVLEEHLHHCVIKAVKAGDGEEIIEKLIGALEQFSRTV